MLAPGASGDPNPGPVVVRSIDDVFVDSYLLRDVEPIRVKMPFNVYDEAADLVAGMRVDRIDAVRAGGPYGSSGTGQARVRVRESAAGVGSIRIRPVQAQPTAALRS